PQLCGYRGRAIYLDADMQVFADIEELWNADLQGNAALVTNQLAPPPQWEGSTWFHPGPQMSVMLLDCGQLEWNVQDIVAGLDRGDYTYEDLMFDLCILPSDKLGTYLPVEWNHLEHYEPGTTKLLHYTVVPTQPWKNSENPLREVWVDGFRQAVSEGAVNAPLVRELVREGHVDQSLLTEAEAHAPAQEAGSRRSAVELELAAVRRRLDTLEAGGLKAWRQRAGRIQRDGKYILNSWRRRALGPALERLRRRP
ncbi:MAG TPA: hypothetical protein VGW38_15195, partial [Chloroflexota bacterium]|nr:hypothetical protein [Chloroflexota bacterium]